MNKDLITIIYYTSNKENKVFEKKITDDLIKKAGDIPIISVSQKPIDLGTNICIGDIGANDMNLYSQVLTGCEAAKTPFVLMAEADCLYPPDYFQFVPEELDMGYRYNNLYIAFLWKDGFYTKTVSQCGQIIGREYYIGLLKKALAAEKVKEILPTWKTFRSDNPIVNIKTGDGLRKVTWTDKNIAPKDEIPYWGSFKDIKKMLSSDDVIMGAPIEGATDTNALLIKKYGEQSEKRIILSQGRNELINIFREAGFTNGAEIGTQRGAFAKEICEGIPGVKLTCVDAWKLYRDYRPSFFRRDGGEREYEAVKELLSKYNTNIIRNFSMKAVREIPDESLDFVYIDANHEFQSATNDIAEWSKKVRKGGIISGHDYIENDDPVHEKVRGEKLQVKEVVDGWVLAKRIKNFYVLSGDRFPSWFWVKE